MESSQNDRTSDFGPPRVNPAAPMVPQGASEETILHQASQLTGLGNRNELKGDGGRRRSP